MYESSYMCEDGYIPIVTVLVVIITMAITRTITR